MSMLRIVLRDGTMMHLEADHIAVDGVGALKLSNKRDDGSYGSVAIFAPGVWAYYLYVVLEGAGC